MLLDKIEKSIKLLEYHLINDKKFDRQFKYMIKSIYKRDKLFTKKIHIPYYIPVPILNENLKDETEKLSKIINKIIMDKSKEQTNKYLKILEEINLNIKKFI